MADGTPRRLARSWFFLLALTGASVLAVRFGGAAAGTALVLGLAMLKARLVILDFMGLRGQAAMSRALLGWCLTIVLGSAAKAIAVAMAIG
ncbi:cytochrome C oxidase subunit IV family protein [Aminobacter sp. AP02]|uniref:cytochrome C oxidase subunit IV family protein n=1 Tax=Aminobacter sp. AP02 TaxID=2135737 RepID=UPI000D6B3DA5|nr:cytochrome C oxidase subunit IV family protein [Aminobacter sp. AP02]PWK73852.1 cytochrome c oxidase subunit IV [Aminobacter sp. AP02]